jgi:cobalamin transport system permease protein
LGDKVYARGLVIAIIALALTTGLSLISGASGVGWPQEDILELRGLRLIASFLVGGSLALTGTAFQTLLRNPLADPYILGVSGGAALGGTIALAAGLPAMAVALGPITLLLDPTFVLAFVGGLLSIAFVFGIALRSRDASLNPYALILVGFALNAFCSALVLFVRVTVETRKTQEILFWLIGNLSDTRMTGANLIVFAIVFLVGGGFLMLSAKRLNLLSLGDDAARSLGVDATRLKLVVLIASSLVVGYSVSLAGMIGFVGIIVPQALRILYGADLRWLMPLSAIYGAVFLGLADVVTRLLFLVLHTELPVGLVSALVGAPAFVWILRREVRGA